MGALRSAAHYVSSGCQGRYNIRVEKTVRIFTSFEEADEANAQYDAALSPEERLRIVIELRDRRHPDAAEQRLERVSRVVELERR
jgi:hypothetical protein